MEGEPEKKRIPIGDSLDALTEFVKQSTTVVTAMSFKGAIDHLCDTIIADAEKDRESAKKKLAELGFEVPDNK